jgi:hypothetical protein
MIRAMRSSESLAGTELGPIRVRALAVGAQSIGALALGALAIGSLGICVIGIGRLFIDRARIRKLHIDVLSVGTVRGWDTAESSGSERRTSFRPEIIRGGE